MQKMPVSRDSRYKECFALNVWKKLKSRRFYHYRGHNCYKNENNINALINSFKEEYDKREASRS